MYFIDNKGITDPRINLAIEEFILRNMDIEKDDFLLFYINQPSIIIGKIKTQSKKLIQIMLKTMGSLL